MTTICIVRHGETEWNKLGKLQGKMNIPLNDTGIYQAKQCARYLSENEWNFIISSPLLRAKQTAMIIKEEINIPLQEMSQFSERDYGDAEGLTKEERTRMYPQKNYPNQESRENLSNRILEGLQKIKMEYADKRVILVAHGAVINAILAALSNNEIGSGKTLLKNASLSEIEYGESQWKINFYNEVTHLS